MSITFEQVRAALQPEEPDYDDAAATLGPAALPHLDRLITGTHALLASKAAYLAGLIGTEQSLPVLRHAAFSDDVRVRIAAAAAAGHLPAERGSELLLSLIDDKDIGVQKVALNAAPAAASAALKKRILRLGMNTANSGIKRLTQAALGRQPTTVPGDAVAATDARLSVRSRKAKRKPADQKTKRRA